MATALTKDFLVKSGLTVQGTSDVSSSTNSTQTLQVNGGASIAKKLYVGGDLNVSGGITFSGATTSTGAFNILSTASATTAGLGALTVAGGGYFGNNLVVMGTAASTGTTSSNALYVAGGAGIAGSLVVGGVTLFKNDVTFSGTATYVYSTNTFYTDNILEVHVPPGGIYSDWALDDGKDIGFRFHYYTPSGVSGTDTNAALVLSNSGNRMLEWYSSGAEGGTGQYSGAQYGGFKTGYIQLTTATAALSTVSGAFQVVGGAGIGKDVYAGSTVSGATLVGRNLTSGRVAFVSTTTTGLLIDDAGLVYVPDADLLVTTVTLAQTATNIASGLAGDIHMQTGAGLTSFIRAGSTGSILVSNGSTATFTSTGSIVVAWAAGSDRANAATNLLNGTAGQIPYQTGISTTGFIAVGTSGYILQSNGTSVPTWVASTATAAGTAITATNIGGGFATAIPYQSNTGTTNFDQAFRWDSTNAIARIANGIFTGTNVSTNTTTGALQVLNGGAGIGGNLNVGGGANIIGITTVTNATQSTTTNTGALQIVNGGAGIGGNVNIGGGLKVTGQTTITNTTNATSTVTGALQVAGGVGIGGDLWVGGNIYLDGVGLDTVYGTTATFTQIYATGTNVSSSTTTGALQVIGGVGIGGNLYVGGVHHNIGTLYADANITGGLNTGSLIVTGGSYVSGQQYVSGRLTVATAAITTSSPISTTVNSYGLSVTGGTYSNVGEGTGTVATLNFNTFAGSTITSSLTATVTSTFTNAATVYISGAPTSTTASVTLSNSWGLYSVAGIRSDGVSYLSNTSSATSTSTGALKVEGGIGVGGAIVVGGTVTAPTFIGALTGIATTATNIAGGSLGQLHYQTGGGSTGFIGTGTVGALLQQGANTSTFVSSSTIHVGTANYAASAGSAGGATLLAITNNQASTNPYYLISVSTSTGNNTATTVAGWGPYVIPSSGVVVINTNTVSGGSAQGALVVGGGVGVGGNLVVGGNSTVTNTLFVLSASNANALNTGALQVKSGGVSVNNDVYVGGTVTAGATGAATSGTVVPAFFSNNTLLASYTSPAITTTASQNLDVFAAGTYRTAKYFIQVTSLGGTGVHITEITVFHDNTNVYLTEYGTAYSNALSNTPIGTFDANLGGGNVTLTFTPSAVSTGTTVKVTRMGTTL